MEIKRLDQTNAEEYRDIRLEALEKNPEAFLSSYEEEKNRPLEEYENRLKTNEMAMTLGAFIDEHLVGIVTLARESRMKIKHRANILGMYVSSSHRTRGLGKTLMEHAIQKARDLGGIEQLYLTVTSPNEPAQRLYASLGFKVYGTDHKAMKIGQTYYDEEHMVLYL